MLDKGEFVVSAMLEEGTLDTRSVERARAYSAEHHVPVEEALVIQGTVTRKALATTRAAICECLFTDLSDYDVNIRNTHLMPRTAADKHQAFPLFDLEGIVTVAMADPLDLGAVDQLRRVLRADVDPVLAEPLALKELIARAYSINADAALSPEAGADPRELLTGEEPIVAAVNHILAQAIAEGASDIHINPDEAELHLRYRIDGALQARQGPPRGAHAGIVQRLKVMAALDLTQTRRSQDGKFRFLHAGRSVDVRLSLIPTLHGENAVMRLLAAGAQIKGFSELGIAPDTAAQVDALLQAPYGIFLATGPTGSGKTTTLYTALKKLNTPDVNVMTIEDPVEIRLPLVRQVQVNAEIGMTFASALRSILRQDPDIVLVGEIRDAETARIAVQAALTGHMVLSTLHTNDAPGAVARLKDMGCPPFAINAALLGVLAQRLVRKVCDSCARPCNPPELILRRFGLHAGVHGFSKGEGCARCLNTGYRGRSVVCEFLRVTAGIQDLIENEASAAPLRQRAIDDGMKPMWRDGLEKARLGVTTLDEVARVVAVSLDDEPAAPVPEARVAA